MPTKDEWFDMLGEARVQGILESFRLLEDFGVLKNLGMWKVTGVLESFRLLFDLGVNKVQRVQEALEHLEGREVQGVLDVFLDSGAEKVQEV